MADQCLRLTPCTSEQPDWPVKITVRSAINQTAAKQEKSLPPQNPVGIDRIFAMAIYRSFTDTLSAHL
jgi:hypothetical protein